MTKGDTPGPLRRLVTDHQLKTHPVQPLVGPRDRSCKHSKHKTNMLHVPTQKPKSKKKRKTHKTNHNKVSTIILVKLYSDLTRPGPRDYGLVTEIPFISGKSRLVKYDFIWPDTFISFNNFRCGAVSFQRECIYNLLPPNGEPPRPGPWRCSRAKWSDKFTCLCYCATKTFHIYSSPSWKDSRMF